MQEHEQALVDAIARLGDASDGESGNGYVWKLAFYVHLLVTWSYRLMHQ